MARINEILEFLQNGDTRWSHLLYKQAIDKADFKNKFWKYLQRSKLRWTQKISMKMREKRPKAGKRKSWKKNYDNSKVSTHIQRTHTSQTNTKHQQWEGMWRRTYLVQLRAWLFHVCAHTRLGHCVYYKGGDLQPPTYFSPLSQNEVRVCLCAQMHMYFDVCTTRKYHHSFTLRISDIV